MNLLQAKTNIIFNMSIAAFVVKDWSNIKNIMTQMYIIYCNEFNTVLLKNCKWN